MYFCDIPNAEMQLPDATEELVAVPAHVVLVAYCAIVTVLPEHETLTDSPLEAWHTPDCTEVDVATVVQVASE